MEQLSKTIEDKEQLAAEKLESEKETEDIRG